jgi:formate-dependent phosphoribosylglycinamide formyltransferase (GAR transformylase)
MNATNRPALFASVRSSKDTALVAFAAALLAAFALHAGAMLPRVGVATPDASMAAAPAAPAHVVQAEAPASPRS